MGSTDVTAVVTTYNQSLDAILRSVASALMQEGAEVELVVSDDRSKTDPLPQVEAFIKAAFPDARYQLRRNDVNLQTVRNIGAAIKCAHGRYVQELGAGDLFHDARLLGDIASFCEANDAVGGFGRIYRFFPADRGGSTVFEADEYNAPRNRDAYAPRPSQDHLELAVQAVRNADWIPGGACFYETRRYSSLLETLGGEYGVRYCEDFAAVISLYDRPFYFLDRPLIWYEWGSGISTGGSAESRKRMYGDHTAFYSALSSSPLPAKAVRDAQRRFRLRRFLALDTPFAAVLQRLVAQGYSSRQEGAPRQPNDFFFDCVALVDDYLSKQDR